MSGPNKPGSLPTSTQGAHLSHAPSLQTSSEYLPSAGADQRPAGEWRGEKKEFCAEVPTDLLTLDPGLPWTSVCPSGDKGWEIEGPASVDGPWAEWVSLSVWSWWVALARSLARLPVRPACS